MKSKRLLSAVAVLAMISASTVLAKPNATWTPGQYMDDFARTYTNGKAVEPPDVEGTSITLSDSVTLIYWNMHYNGTFVIQDSVLVAKCLDGGCYRFATSGSKKWKYTVIRMKGDVRASNDLIYVRLASQGPSDSGGISDASKGGVSERMLDSLVDPDSANMPDISDQFQLYVVDMAKNGLHFGDVGGANACQIGSHAAMELDIDYIYTTNVNPMGSGVIGSKSISAGKAAKNQAKAWMAGPSKLMVKAGNSGSLSSLALYDIQGKMVKQFALHGQQSVVNFSSVLRAGNIMYYAVRGTSGSILGKGKIVVR